LILDDDQDSRELFGEILRRNGLEVDEFGTAEEALESMQTELPAVILLDLTLGAGMNGYEAARRIRELASAAQPQLFAMTGYSSDRVKNDGALFDLVLTKPVDSEALIRTVKQFAA
jgi:CheY-like chemotaxis protein